MTAVEWQMAETLLRKIWLRWEEPNAEQRRRIYAIFREWPAAEFKAAVDEYFAQHPDTRGPHFADIRALRRKSTSGGEIGSESKETILAWRRKIDKETSRFRARWTTLGKADQEAVRTWAMEWAPKLARDAIGDATDPLDDAVLRAYCSEGMRVVLDGEPPDAVESCEHVRWRLDKQAAEAAEQRGHVVTREPESAAPYPRVR